MLEHGAHTWAPTGPPPLPSCTGAWASRGPHKVRSGYQPGSYVPHPPWPCKNWLLAVAGAHVTVPCEVSHLSCSRGCSLTRCLQGSLALGTIGEGG